MISTRRRTGAAILAVVAAASISVACGTGDTEATPVTTTTQPVLTGPEGVEKSPEQQATEQATAKNAEFFAVLAKVEGDPLVDVNTLDTVASGKILDQLKANINFRRSQGIVAKGALQVVNAEVTQLEAPKDEDGNPIPGKASASMRVCVDNSNYDTVRPDGTSTLDPARIQQELGKPTLENPSWPDSSGWRVVSDSVTAGGTPCDAP